MKLSRFLVVAVVLAAVSCEKAPSERLQYGLHEGESQSVFWVAMDGEMRFMLSAPKAEDVMEELDNWEKTESNVIYTAESMESEHRS